MIKINRSLLFFLSFLATSFVYAKNPLEIFHGAPTYDECLAKSRVEDDALLDGNIWLNGNGRSTGEVLNIILEKRAKIGKGLIYI